MEHIDVVGARAPELPLARVELEIEAVKRLQLPDDRGNFWRSVFGLWLKRLSDDEDAPPTIGAFNTSDLFEYFFETETSPHAQPTKIGATPHPYVIDAPPPDRARS